MKLSERAVRAMPPRRVLEERDGERLVFCGETVRYRLEAKRPEGWTLVAASGWLPEVVGLPAVDGFHDRLAERFPAARLLPFAAREFR